MPCEIPILVEETDIDQISRSPIYEIIQHIFGSIIAIAPEKTNEILGLIFGHDVKFSLENRERFDFAVKLSESKISVSLQGLEFLWATSYAYYVIYQTAALPENQSKGVLSLLDHPETCTAAKLLQWAVDRETSKVANIPWPSDCPKPQRSAESSGLSNSNATWVAQEMFLCAVGWILHHELAHIRLGHRDIPLDSLKEETEADKLATETLVQGITDKDHLFKRGLGITNALLALCCLDMETRDVQWSNIPRSHPNVAERLFRALGHQALANQSDVYTFAVYILKLHFDHLGIEIHPRDYADVKCCLSDYCYELQEWQRRSK